LQRHEGRAFAFSSLSTERLIDPVPAGARLQLWVLAGISTMVLLPRKKNHTVRGQDQA
jgi:hypothetical protein